MHEVKKAETIGFMLLKYPFIDDLNAEKIKIIHECSRRRQLIIIIFVHCSLKSHVKFTIITTDLQQKDTIVLN